MTNSAGAPSVRRAAASLPFGTGPLPTSDPQQASKNQPGPDQEMGHPVSRRQRRRRRATLPPQHHPTGGGQRHHWNPGIPTNAAGLTLDGNVSVNGPGNVEPGSWYLLNNGKIQGGSVTTQNGAALIGTNTGYLAGGVTINGVFDLGHYYSTIYVTGGLTLNGTINLGGATNGYYSILAFTGGGSQTLSSTTGGHIILGNSSANSLTTGPQTGSSCPSPNIVIDVGIHQLLALSQRHLGLRAEPGHYRRQQQPQPGPSTSTAPVGPTPA